MLRISDNIPTVGEGQSYLIGSLRSEAARGIQFPTNLEGPRFAGGPFRIRCHANSVTEGGNPPPVKRFAPDPVGRGFIPRRVILSEAKDLR